LRGERQQEPDGKGLFQQVRAQRLQGDKRRHKAGRADQSIGSAGDERSGIDISSQKSKIVTEDMIRSAARSVNMGCMDRIECPLLFLNNSIDWGIEDPKGRPLEKVREIRDKREE
jgi:protein-tyrosine-phosphatase